MKRLLLAVLMLFVISGVALAVVNINTATKEELTSLKGVGDKRAQEIINYRTKNGPFKSIEELEKVPGIGPGIMKQIRSEVTTTGKTTTDKPAGGGTKAKAGDATKGKSAEAKKGEPAKGDAMKAEKAKEKVAEKSKGDEKKAGK